MLGIPSRNKRSYLYGRLLPTGAPLSLSFLSFNVSELVSIITYFRSASMKKLSLLFQLLSLCLICVSNAAPAPAASLTKRAAPPISTACGDVVNSEGKNSSKAEIGDCRI